MSLTRFCAPKVWLAPMSGSTDAAFRAQVVKFGAPAVVSEMVAGDAFNHARPDVVRRATRHAGANQWIVQLAGRSPDVVREAAAKLAANGVDVIDINMGCPSRQVTGGSSGSALMREPDLALAIVKATIEGAGDTPVTLKMRLGWDHDSLNAPAIGKAAEDAGIRMLTVHGRTRCQFYKGEADWVAIKPTVDAVSIPVIANGDISSVKDAELALEQSGADGVMIGRAAMGQPWLPAQIAAHLDGHSYIIPDLKTQCDSLCEQIDDSLTLYGRSLGLRIVRKHVAASIDKLDISFPDDQRRAHRATLCQIEDPGRLIMAIENLYLNDAVELAA